MKGVGKRRWRERSLNRGSIVRRVVVESRSKGQGKGVLQWVGG